MSTLIKRLSQNGQEFVPITLQEAVVVNTTNIPSLNGLGITTLDKVLKSTLGLIDDKVSSDTLTQTVNTINTELAKKQNKLTAGNGIEITETGVINCTLSLELYEVVTQLPTASKDCLNKIYLKPSDSEFLEYICIEVSSNNYVWEQFGKLKTDIDVDNFVTKEYFAQQLGSLQTSIDSKIDAIDATTSTGVKVQVSYDIPENLYDSAVSDNSDQIV